MARIVFTSNLRRHIDCPPIEVTGQTVRDALREVFSGNPALRGYVLDDQGRLRRHVLVFVDNERIKDRTGLSDPVAENSEVFVMQALSGG